MTRNANFYLYTFILYSNYEKYRTKMRNHKKLVEATESSSDVNKNVETVTQEIELLTKESR